MIEFDLMVRNILWEASTVGAAGTNQGNVVNEPGEDQQDVRGLFGFFVTGSPKPYSTLQSLWSKNFKVFQFPNEQDLNRICYGVISSLPRTVKDPSKFNNFESVFPLIDLTAQLYEQHYKGKAIPSPESTKITFTTFLQNIQKQITNSKNNLKPLDYFPINPWAQTLKTAFLSTGKQELGKIRVGSLDPKLSIYQAIFEILKIRQKVVSLKLPGPLKSLTGEDVVNKILLEPWSIVSGKFPINDEKIKALYDQVTVDQLVNLSLVCYKLYNQQISTNIQSDATDIGYTAQRYNQFMGVNGATPFQWLAKGQTPSVLESFDALFNNLSEEFLIEKEETRSNQEVNSSLRRRYQTDLVLKAALANSAAVKSSKFKGSLNVAPKAFESKPGMGTFVYNIAKLKEAGTNFRIEEASEVLNQIEFFANYIKTKESRDIMGGLAQLTKGLSFGVKNMGT